MLAIGIRFIKTKNVLGPCPKTLIEIIDGPRTISDKRTEWCVKTTHTELDIDGKKIQIVNEYWVGEDYLLNDLKRKRMIIKKGKEGKNGNF